MTRSRGRLFAPALLAVSLTTLTSSAQPGGDNRAVAEALFREGKQLLATRQVAAACEKFAESQRLDPQLGTMLNLADCHEKQGLTATAWAEFISVESQAGRAGQAAREAYAKQRAGELEPMLARLTLVGSIENVDVTINGVRVGQGQLGSAVPRDPGEYTIVASAPGKREWRTTVTLVSAKTLRVELPPLAGAAEPLAAPPPAVEEAAAPESPTKLIVGIALAAVGAAGVTVGTIFGLQTFSKADEAGCSSAGCATQAQLDSYEDAQSAATVSTIAFVVGAVALGAGAWFFVDYARDRGKTKQARAGNPFAFHF